MSQLHILIALTPFPFHSFPNEKEYSVPVCVRLCVCVCVCVNYKAFINDFTIWKQNHSAVNNILSVNILLVIPDKIPKQGSLTY